MSNATCQTIIYGVAFLAAVLAGMCCYEAGRSEIVQPGWTAALLLTGVFCGLAVIALLAMARAVERL